MAARAAPHMRPCRSLERGRRSRSRCRRGRGSSPCAHRSRTSPATRARFLGRRCSRPAHRGRPRTPCAVHGRRARAASRCKGICARQAPHRLRRVREERGFGAQQPAAAARLRGPRPSPADAQLPGPVPAHSPGQHPRLVISDNDHLLAVSQVNARDRVAHRHRLPQPGQARYGCDHPGTHHYGQTQTSSSCARDQDPKSASGGRPDVSDRYAKPFTMPRTGR